MVNGNKRFVCWVSSKYTPYRSKRIKKKNVIIGPLKKMPKIDRMNNLIHMTIQERIIHRQNRKNAATRIQKVFRGWSSIRVKVY